MHLSNRGSLRQQVRFLQRHFLQEGNLPFTDVLSQEVISQALTAAGVAWKDRIYSPLVTLWVFLSQVLSADHSCRSAVARLIAFRISRGQEACSSRTGAYCQARERLPEKFFSAITCLAGKALNSQVDPSWLWKGRSVYMFDGTTVSMPDTVANQRDFPQTPNQRPGLGFPIARIGAITSLSCGAILNLGFGKYAGKGEGEVGILRKIWHVLSPGDILLADRLISNWTNIVMLRERGIELVSRLNKAHRKADFRKGTRLSKEDHLVYWRKPPSIRSLDWESYKAMPDGFTIREVRIHIQQPGFRSKSIVVVNTILDPKEATKEDLAQLYRARWHNELDLRSVKVTLQMDILRCKTPELVRKEVWTHILAYNLIRTIMAQAAYKHGMEPRTISFSATLQSLEAFQPLIAYMGRRGSDYRAELYHLLLDAIASHRVGNRPDRFEPRYKKRRKKWFTELNVPRYEAKLAMVKERK